MLASNIENKDLIDIRISVVCPWFLWGDAVGHSSFDYYRALKGIGFKNVRGIGTRNDFPDMDFEHCETVDELEKNAWFNASDLVIYHFAIYHEYFEILKKDKHGRHVICFHNVTPKHLTPESIWHVIDKSFAQIALFKYADAIWVDSRENEEELKRQGIINTPITEISIPVERPPLTTILEKPSKRIDLLYVGRFFPSKGVTDLIEAIALLKQSSSYPFLLRLVGNTDFSDPGYVSEVKSKIGLYGLGEYIDFVGKVDENTLARLYKCSHIFVIASYHEGFCVPVIEALRAGMVPVTYNAGNLRWIASGNGRTVETGNIKALATSISEVINGLANSFNDADGFVLPLEKGMKSSRQFSAEVQEYSTGFSFDCFAGRLSQAISELFS